MSILKIRDNNGNVSEILTIRGPKGEPGSDATVTADKVKSVLGYTPANQTDIEDLSDAIDALNDHDWFTEGTSIPTNGDLNDYTTAGKYYVGSTSIAGTIKNAPVTNSNYKMYVMVRTTDKSISQIVFALNNKIYMRSATASGAFSGWKTFATTDDIEALTIESVSESQEDGGSNIVTFSDGKTLTVNNGNRGSSIYRVTTALSSYTTATGGFTPKYRIALSTVLSQSGASEVRVGDTILRNYYTYPVGYVDANYVYVGAYSSIRGSAGTSVTVSSVSESAEDGGENVVTFSDGKTLTVKNGKQGAAGKTAYQYAQDGGYEGTEAEFAEKLANEYTLNPLYGKKVSFVGDSICAGSDNENSYLGGYGRIIAERNNMAYENISQGGATVAAGTISMTTGADRMWLCRKIADMSADADYAIIEGGINDAWYWADGREYEIGSISKGYTATLDDTTYYGAFESMLKQLVTRFAGKKIGYIAVPKIMSLYDSEQNVPNFYHIALECCAKWGVPVCDLNTIVPPFTNIEELKNAYAPDGTHPNYDGYIKYYCDPIEEWMKTLTTGGNNSATIARKAVEEYTQGFNDAIEALRKGKLDNTGISFRKARLPLADGTTIEIDVLTAIDGSVVIPYVNRIPLSIDTNGTIYGEDNNGDGENDGYLTGQRLSSSGATKDMVGSYVTGYIPAKGGDEIRIFGCGWGTTQNAMNYICAYDVNFNFIGGHATKNGAETTTLSGYTATVATLKSVDENADTTLTLANNSAIAYIRVSSAGDAKGYDTNLNFANAIVTVNEEITE